MSAPAGIVVMGVSGCGKSTVGAALARALTVPFLEADDLHSAHNREKMQRGRPLTDADRAPWLDAIAQALADAQRHRSGLVITCSALKLAYRDRLRAAAADIRFVFLDASLPVIEQRLRTRHHPFMPSALLMSQFTALERPGANEPEPDTVTVAADAKVAVVVAAALAALCPPDHQSH